MLLMIFQDLPWPKELDLLFKPPTRIYSICFAVMPKLLEYSTSSKGTITGLYTVLVDGDDLNEPVTDTARGIIDGHYFISKIS